MRKKCFFASGLLRYLIRKTKKTASTPMNVIIVIQKIQRKANRSPGHAPSERAAATTFPSPDRFRHGRRWRKTEAPTSK